MRARARNYTCLSFLARDIARDSRCICGLLMHLSPRRMCSSPEADFPCKKFSVVSYRAAQNDILVHTNSIPIFEKLPLSHLQKLSDTRYTARIGAPFRFLSNRLTRFTVHNVNEYGANEMANERAEQKKKREERNITPLLVVPRFSRPRSSDRSPM